MNQINELNKGMNSLNSKNNDVINKLNMDLDNEKNKTKQLEEKIEDLVKQNKIDLQNLEKELNSRKNDFNVKNDEFLNIKKKV